MAIELNIDKQLIITMIIVLVLVMAIGFIIGQYNANKQWSDYHQKYKDRIAEYCSIDPEVQSSIPQKVFKPYQPDA